MNWLYKAEKKFGKYAIKNLMYYIIGIMIMGVLIQFYDDVAIRSGKAGIYLSYLCLDFSMIAKGQVWRLLTFLLAPSQDSIIFLVIMLYMYYSIGSTLEQVWGSFRFNVYYFSGIILTILAGLIIYLNFSSDPLIVYYMPQGLEFVNQSIFLAFAFMFPDTSFLLFFILPIKAKWLGVAYLAMTIYQAAQYISSGSWPFAVYLIVSLANFFVFFFMTRNYRRISPSEMKRKAAYKKKVYQAKSSGPKHKCAICGRTEQDHPELEFRYCSKCDGNYEYCQEHLFTHEHVHH